MSVYHPLSCGWSALYHQMILDSCTIRLDNWCIWTSSIQQQWVFRCIFRRSENIMTRLFIVAYVLVTSAEEPSPRRWGIWKDADKNAKVAAARPKLLQPDETMHSLPFQHRNDVVKACEIVPSVLMQRRSEGTAMRQRCWEKDKSCCSQKKPCMCSAVSASQRCWKGVSNCSECVDASNKCCCGVGEKLADCREKKWKCTWSPSELCCI